VTTPGHVEVDLVHHCGRYAGGEYAHTLHLVDVASGWSEDVFATLLPSHPMYTPIQRKEEARPLGDVFI